MKRCPYCGEKILAGVAQCEQCGKSLGKKNGNSANPEGLTNLDAWNKKTVPTWLMAVMVALALFCVYLMFAKGCQGKATDQNDENAARPLKQEMMETPQMACESWPSVHPPIHRHNASSENLI